MEDLMSDDKHEIDPKDRFKSPLTPRNRALGFILSERQRQVHLWGGGDGANAEHDDGKSLEDWVRLIGSQVHQLSCAKNPTRSLRQLQQIGALAVAALEVQFRQHPELLEHQSCQRCGDLCEGGAAWSDFSGEWEDTETGARYEELCEQCFDFCTDEDEEVQS